MAESDAWAHLRAYASAPTAPLDPEPPDAAPAEPSEPSEPSEPGEPGEPRRRRFHPGAIGPTLDRVLPAGLVDRAARIPTPGGLFPLVAALLFFLLAIVPVDAQGHTRLEMLWRVLTGGATLPATGGLPAGAATAGSLASAAAGGAVLGAAGAGAAVGGLVQTPAGNLVSGGLLGGAVQAGTQQLNALWSELADVGHLL